MMNLPTAFLLTTSAAILCTSNVVDAAIYSETIAKCSDEFHACIGSTTYDTPPACFGEGCLEENYEIIKWEFLKEGVTEEEFNNSAYEATKAAMSGLEVNVGFNFDTQECYVDIYNATTFYDSPQWNNINYTGFSGDYYGEFTCNSCSPCKDDNVLSADCTNLEHGRKVECEPIEPFFYPLEVEGHDHSMDTDNEASSATTIRLGASMMSASAAIMMIFFA